MAQAVYVTGQWSVKRLQSPSDSPSVSPMKKLHAFAAAFFSVTLRFPVTRTVVETSIPEFQIEQVKPLLTMDAELSGGA